MQTTQYAILLRVSRSWGLLFFWARGMIRFPIWIFSHRWVRSNSMMHRFSILTRQVFCVVEHLQCWLLFIFAKTIHRCVECVVMTTYHITYVTIDKKCLVSSTLTHPIVYLNVFSVIWTCICENMLFIYCLNSI